MVEKKLKKEILNINEAVEILKEVFIAKEYYIYNSTLTECIILLLQELENKDKELKELKEKNKEYFGKILELSKEPKEYEFSIKGE